MPLAKTDAYLWNLEQISNFTLRVECWMYRATFAEFVSDLEKRIVAIDAGITELKTCNVIEQVIHPFRCIPCEADGDDAGVGHCACMW